METKVLGVKPSMPIEMFTKEGQNTPKNTKL